MNRKGLHLFFLHRIFCLISNSLIFVELIRYSFPPSELTNAGKGTLPSCFIANFLLSFYPRLVIWVRKQNRNSNASADAMNVTTSHVLKRLRRRGSEVCQAEYGTLYKASHNVPALLTRRSDWANQAAWNVHRRGASSSSAFEITGYTNTSRKKRRFTVFHCGWFFEQR